MVQLTANIVFAVYEKAPKKALYKKVTMNGKQSRRLAVLGVSNADSLRKRLLANVATDAMYDFASEEPAVSIPEDANEFSAEDVVQMSLGFVKGQVCPAPIVDIVLLDESASPRTVRGHVEVCSFRSKLMNIVCLLFFVSRHEREAICQQLHDAFKSMRCWVGAGDGLWVHFMYRPLICLVTFLCECH
jgi:hypothetical protein